MCAEVASYCNAFHECGLKKGSLHLPRRTCTGSRVVRGGEAIANIELLCVIFINTSNVILLIVDFLFLHSSCSSCRSSLGHALAEPLLCRDSTRASAASGIGAAVDAVAGLVRIFFTNQLTPPSALVCRAPVLVGGSCLLPCRQYYLPPWTRTSSPPRWTLSSSAAYASKSWWIRARVS